MVDTIYIIRHGFRLNWLSNTWKSETGMARDPPLAAFGVMQADETAKYFASLPEDERPTVILSSPYYRCLQTAKPVSAALGVPIFVEHGLSEWYSPAAPGTGLHPRPGPASSLHQYFPEHIDTAWQSIWYPSRRGEDVPQILDRAAGFARALLPELEKRAPGARRVLLVSHAATVVALARVLSGDRELPVRIGCCTLTHFERVDGEGREENEGLGRWETKLLASGKHLMDGSLREWGLQDIEIDKGQVVEDKGEPGTENEKDEPVGCQIQLNSNL